MTAMNKPGEHVIVDDVNIHGPLNLPSRMPILDADRAKNVIVAKRGKGTGYSGVDNALIYGDNCRMLYGDAQPCVGEIIQQLKALG